MLRPGTREEAAAWTALRASTTRSWRGAAAGRHRRAAGDLPRPSAGGTGGPRHHERSLGAMYQASAGPALDLPADLLPLAASLMTWPPSTRYLRCGRGSLCSRSMPDGTGLARPDLGLSDRPLCRLGGGPLPAARSLRPHRPMDLPAARWVMVGGIVLGALVALAVLVLLWRRRRAIGTWLVTRDRGVKLALAAALGAVLLLIVGSGCQGPRLHHARQRFLPGLPHLRAQRPTVRPPGYWDLPPGQQAGG